MRSSADRYDARYRAAYEAGAEFLDVRGPTGLLAEFVRRYAFPPGAKALDVACGEGRDCIFLARRDFQVLGIDSARSAIHRARRRAAAEGLRITFRFGDMAKMARLKSGTFDLVVNIDSLHLLTDPMARAQHYREAFKILREGGYYFLCAHVAERTRRGKGGSLRSLRLRSGRRWITIRVRRLPFLIRTRRGYERELLAARFFVLGSTVTRTYPIDGHVCGIVAQRI